MSSSAEKRRRRSGRPLWLVEGLDIVEQRRGPLLGAVGLVVVIPLLLAIFAPSVVPPTPLVGAAVAVAALLLGLAAALAVDTTDLIVRGPRHVGAAGGELVALLPNEANPGSVRSLAVSVLEAREPGTQLLLGIAGAGREAAETAGWTEALGMALVRSGVSVLRIDLASGRTESPGLAEVIKGEHRLTEVVEIEPGRRLARLGAGGDPIRALRSLPSLPGRLPADLDVLLVALPSATNREVVNASRALDHMLVMAHRDSTSRVQLIAALDALGSTGATAQVVLVDDRTVARLGPGAPLRGTAIADGTSRSEPTEPTEPSETPDSVGDTETPYTETARDPGAAQVDEDDPPPGVAGVTGVGGGAVVAAQLARRMSRPEPTPDAAEDAEPAAETAEGRADDAEPVADEPAAVDAEPAVDDAEPAADGAEPVVDEPAAEGADPAVDDAEPWADLPPPQMPSDRPEVAPDADDGSPDSAGVAAGPGLPPSVAPAPGPFGDWVARQAARDDAARKAAREEAARADAARAAREEAVREEAAREDAVREAAAREEAAREDAAREEAAAREAAAREEAAREEAARAPERDPEAQHEEPRASEPLASEPREVDVLLGAAEAAALAITDIRSEGPPDAPAVERTTPDDRGAVDPVPASMAPPAADLAPPPASTERPGDAPAADDDPTADATADATADDDTADDDTDELPAVRRPEPIRPAESEQDDLLRTTAQLAVLMDDLDVRTDDRP